MSGMQTAYNSKFKAEDLNVFLKEPQLVKDSPKTKQQKRCKANEDKDEPELAPVNDSNAKKRKINEEIKVCGEPRQKILHVMSELLDSRNLVNNNLQKSLEEVLNHCEADYDALKDNEHKLEHLTNSFMKCIQQATAAQKQTLRGIKEVQALFKKECEEMEEDHKTEMDKLGEELEEDINNLKQKLIFETKRNGWETLKRSFLQAMQNDY